MLIDGGTEAPANAYNVIIAAIGAAVPSVGVIIAYLLTRLRASDDKREIKDKLEVADRTKNRKLDYISTSVNGGMAKLRDENAKLKLMVASLRAEIKGIRKRKRVS